jgi:hypothetical protein
MGKGVVKLGEGNWAVKDGNLLAAKETNNRFKNAEFTVTRGTDATYVGKDGLIKTASFYNLLPYSEDFEYPNWLNNTIDFQHGYESPTGSNTATKITATGADPYVYKHINVTQNQIYTFSFYCKGEGSSVGKTARVLFWYGAGTATGPTVSHEFNLTNEWEQIKFQTTPTGSGLLPFRIDIPANTSEVGDVAYIWGAQLVESTEALDYQYTNGKEGIPRIDFTDNTDGHLLLEPESTNLITYSEDFSETGTDWSFGNGGTGSDPVETKENISSPDGSLGVSKIVFNNGGGTTSSDYTFTVHPYTSAADDFTTSIYLKGENGGEKIFVDSNNGNNNIVTLTTSWERYEITRTHTLTTERYVRIGLRGGTGSDVGETTVYAWGAQHEQKSYTTSYIPTNGSTVTRDAETCTGAGEAIDFNSEEGVLYAEIAMLSENDKDSNNQLFLNDGTSLQRVGIFTESAGDIRVQIRDNDEAIDIRNLTALDQSESGIDTAEFNKIAILYKSGQNKLFVNGSRITDTNFDNMTFDLSTLSELDLGSGANSNYFRGKVKAIRVYKETDGIDLATLTS